MIQLKNILVALILLVSVAQLSAQTEAEMKAQADKLFDTEQYLDATPLYLRLVALQPKDAMYNYKYGTCLLFNSNKKQDAIKHLSAAVNDPNIPVEAYYYLGRALHLDYRFNDAIKYYALYNEKKIKTTKQFDADRDIRMCQNGKRLMTTISDLIVTDKKEITSDKFFRIYDLHDIGGSMLVTAEFQSKLDKKYNHIPLIHFPQKPSVIYYSSYGDNEATGKDIYVRRRLPDGSWGLPQPIPGNVNTQFDEDYPYMHPDGQYLYFSSKGHNSMGGYDVFRSKIDPETGAFGPPENMDFAISSPDDDMFYIVDSLNKNAYFASARQSELGKLYVYKVLVERVPIQLSVIKGNFVSEVDPSIKKIDFQIKDYATGEDIGRFNSNDKAVYLITFPKGGKYEYVMNIEGSSKEFRSIVSIPFLKEFKPLKQKIVHAYDENGREIVKIINLFNEEVEDPQSVIAEVIKKRSELNVNVQEFDMEEIEQEREKKVALDELGMGDLLAVEIADRLAKEAEKALQNKKQAEEITNNINALVIQNSEVFKKLEAQIKEKVAEANKAQNEENKYILLREAQNLIRKQNDLNTESKNLMRLADSVNAVITSSASAGKINQLNDIAKTFDKIYRDEDEKAAIDYLIQNKELVRGALNDNTTSLVQNLVDRIVVIDDKLNGLNDKIDAYSRELKDLDIEIQVLQNSKETAKKKEWEEIDRKISQKKEEVLLIQEEKKRLEKQVEVLNGEKYILKKQVDLLQEALRNKTTIVVAKENATRALKETEKTNTNTLTSYVNQQIDVMEKNDPTLRDKVIVSFVMKEENIMAEHQTEQERIQNNPSLNEEKQTEKLLSNALKTKKALQERLRDIEEQLSKNKFDDKLSKEKLAIEKSLAQIEQEIERHEKELSAIRGTDIASSNNDWVNEIDPKYDQKREKITNNGSLSQKEKLEQQQSLDQELISQIDKEIDLTQEQIKKDPNNQQLKNKEQKLTQLKEKKEKEIYTREEELTSLNEILQPSKNDQTFIEEISPGYSNKLQVINADPNLTQPEKLQKEIELEEDLIRDLDQSIAAMEAALKKNPTDRQLATDLMQIRKIREEKGNSVKTLKEELNALDTDGPQITTVSTTRELSAQLLPQYEDKVSSIEKDNSKTKLEKLSAIQTIDQELKFKAQQEVSRLESALKKDPQNEELKNRLAITKELIEEIEARMKERAVEIEEEKQRTENTDVASQNESSELIASIDPKFDKAIESIQKNEGLSEEEKLSQIQVKEKELIANIDKAIERNNKVLDKNPEDEEAKTSKEELEQLKAIVESRVEEREQEIASLVKKEVDPKEFAKNKIATLNSLDKTYADQKKLLEGKDPLDYDGLIELEDKLLQKLDKEKQSVQKTLAKDPFNKEAVQQLQVLESLFRDTKAEKEKWELLKTEGSLVSKEEKRTMIDAVDPTYQEKKQELAQNVVSTENIDSRIELEKRFVADVNTKIEVDKMVLEQEPDNELLKNEVMVLEVVKTDAEKEIARLEKEKEQLSEPVAKVTEREKETLIDQLDNTYASKSEEINEDNEISEIERMEEQVLLDRNLLNNAYERLEQVNEQLKADPSNVQLKREKLVLEALIAEFEQRIQANEEQLSVVVKTSAIDQAMIDRFTDQLDPAYRNDVKFIQKSNTFDPLKKLEMLQREDQGLLQKVEDRLNVIELSGPNLSPEMEQEKLALQKLKADLIEAVYERTKNLEELKKGIASNPIDQVTINQIKDQLDPAYRNDIKLIQESNRFDPLKKLEMLQREDQGLLQKVEDRLNVIELSGPNLSPEMEQEKLALQKLKSDLIEAIEGRAKEIETLKGDVASNPIEQKEKIEELMPDYFDQKEQVKQDNTLTREEKNERQEEINNELIEKIDARKEVIESELQNDPENSGLNSELEGLNQLTASVEKENEQLAGTSSTQVAAEKLTADIKPDYADRKTELNNSKMEELAKTNGLIKLEKELLAELITEQKEVDRLLKKDPSNTELIKKNELLSSLIAQQNQTIAKLEQRKTSIEAEALSQKEITSLDKTFESDMNKLKEEGNTALMADREKEHQELIQKKVAQNEATLTKKNDPELTQLNEKLKEEIASSEERENVYRSSSTQETAEVAERKKAYISNFREDNLSGNENALKNEYNSVEELQQQDEVLTNYETSIKEKIAQVDDQLKNDPNSSELLQEKKWLEDELKEVQAKRRKISISIGELETSLMASNRTSENRVDSPELAQLDQKEAELKKSLAEGNVSGAEQKKLEKELSTVQQEQVKVENELLNTYVEQKNTQNEIELKTLKEDLSSEDPTVRSAVQQAENDLNEAEQLTAEANKSKNQDEKNYLLNEAASKQESAEEKIRTAAYENELNKIEEEYGITELDTKAELEQKKRRFSIQVGELTQEIMALDQAAQVSDKKELAQIQEQKKAKEQEKRLVESELRKVEEQLADIEERAPVVDPKADEISLSYNEERELASTEEYRYYVEKVNEAILVEKQLINLESEIAIERKELKNATAQLMEDPSEANKQRQAESAARLKQLEQEKETLTNELEGKRQIADAQLPSNEEEAMKMQNLVRRAVAPINKIAIAAALVPMPENGLAINTNGASTYTAANPIPVNVNNPTGLVYRVQVGAFAKPIPQETFKEFNPVSGETLNNGITRYMAGFFNSSDKVMDARDQIRALGYADAFPVAYCDGKRISIFEARQLEASGQCVPKGENELMMEIAAATAVHMGLEDTTKLKKVPEYTYNQAPGAAKADPIEARKGLFFTVQIGVYNKPVSSGVLYNLEPFMTLRLPNGQIRYSTGIYHGLDEARPKKLEAIEKGVKDAFITAYFNGDRIPINDALKMLEEKGAAVLEPKEKKEETQSTGTTNVTNTNTTTNNVNYTGTSITVEKIEEVEVEKIYYQIVTKKSFNDFPRDVLNRYNSHGSFYFDETDRKVKSVIHESEDELPQVFYFRDDIDTLKFKTTDEFTLGNVLQTEFVDGKIPGDAADWLLRQNYRKEFVQSEMSIILRIHGVTEERIEELRTEGRIFGLEFDVLENETTTKEK